MMAIGPIGGRPLKLPLALALALKLPLAVLGMAQRPRGGRPL